MRVIGKLALFLFTGAMAATASSVAAVGQPASPAPAQVQLPTSGGGGGRAAGPAIGVPTLGMPFVHDPSTVVRSKGRYYVYATGRGIPFYSSPDGETWTREGSVFQQIPDDVHAAVPKNDGTNVWAPDLVRVNGQFYLYYAVSSWGSFQSVVALATNPVLDPKDPAYKWTSRGVVVGSDGVEDLNAIDPGVIHAPDGTLWICYGSYHGSIRVTQLDPKSGLALHPGQLGAPVATARQSEASDIISHQGYYYLFVNHGSCCKGKDSEYNIRVGRSKSITGPYLDKHGETTESGGGSLFLAAHDHRIGPGHFGRVLDYDASPDGSEGGPERFSMHYEADTTRNGRSVLDIRPLLWSQDGWPVAGDNLVEGTYQIVARQSENTLEIHSAGAPASAAATGATAQPAVALAVSQDPPQLRIGRYLTLDTQKWHISPVGGGFYSLINAGTGLAIGSSSTEPISMAAYAGTDGQMWRLEQYPEGGYRIVSKATGMGLTSTGAGLAAAREFVRDDQHLWTITTP